MLVPHIALRHTYIQYMYVLNDKQKQLCVRLFEIFGIVIL